jgi:hypothetical protein
MHPGSIGVRSCALTPSGSPNGSMWYKGTHWLAFCDMFGLPPVKPSFDCDAPATWW